MIYALALFGIGIVLTIIGGFITTIMHPGRLNDMVRAMFDPVRTGLAGDANNTFKRAAMSDPRAKWFLGVGMVCGLAGILLLPFSQGQTARSDAKRQSDTNIDSRIDRGDKI
jgi:hypothetical protein